VAYLEVFTYHSKRINSINKGCRKHWRYCQNIWPGRWRGHFW